MDDWGHLEWSPTGKAPTAASATAVGGYPASMLNSRTGNAPIGLDLINRGDLDRGALNDNTQIDAKGTVKVQVGGKTATEKAADKTELFKNGSMTNMEQMPHTATNSHGSPTVDETAKQYMASR